MKLHHIVLAIFFVCLVGMAGTSYLASMAEKNDKTVDMTGLSSFNSSLAAMANSTNQRYSDAKKLVIDITKLNLLAIPYDMLKTGWSGIKTMLVGFDTISTITSDLTNGLSKTLNLPEWLIPTLMYMLMALVAFMLLYMFLKWRLET